MQSPSVKKSEIVSILLGAMILFAVSASVGFYISSNNYFESSVELERVAFAPIFINNVIALIISVLGIVIMGVPSYVNGIVTGFSLGGALGASIKQFGWSWTLVTMVPHSIFELPVIIISVSYGFIPWKVLGERLRNPDLKVKQLLMRWRKYVIISFLCSIPLLVLAAVLESYSSK